MGSRSNGPNLCNACPLMWSCALTQIILYQQLQELAQASGLTADLVRHWFSTKASLPRMEQTAASHAAGPRPVEPPGAAAEPQSTGSSPQEPQPGGGTEEKMEQSVCGVATEAEEAEADETVNPCKGSFHVWSCV